MQRPRTPPKLSESLHRQLNSYALAAGAAGVGLLALAQPAEAKVVYTPIHKKILVNKGPFLLDLNHDGLSDFYLSNGSSGHFSSSMRFWLKVVPIRQNQIWGTTNCGWDICAAALPAGYSIGVGTNQFKAANTVMIADYWIHDYGAWSNVTKRYLGLKFSTKGKIHFGWARLSVKTTRDSITPILTGYAYETIPNKPIIAGKTHGKDVITLEPASLGHLARGASAISAWRRTNSVAASH